MPDLERWVMPHRSVDMRDWEVARNMATNVHRPDRSRLMDLYDSILVDSHLASTMESRVLRVVRSKYRLLKGDKPQPELLPLLETQWFEDFLQYVCEAAFRGHTLIELGELARPGELRNVTRIDPRNVLPWSGVVVRRQGEETGYPFREPPLNAYLIEVGRPEELGLLADVAPVAIVKKYAVGSWSDYVHKYGIPPRWVKTNSRDARRFKQLEQMMQNMLSSAYGVIEGDEEIQIMQTPGTDAWRVFDQLITRMNSEMSKRLLGQDGTSDNKDASGTYGSLKVLQGVAEDRHAADKAAVRHVVNNELLPRLTALGYPFAGVRFEWDELRDMAPMELVDAVAKLGMVFDIDPEHVEERTGIRILGARRMPGELGGGDWPPSGGGNPPGNGRQGGGQPEPPKREEDGEDEDEDGDGVTAQWPRDTLGACGVCGGGIDMDITAEAGLAPLTEDEVEQVLREIEDSGGLFSQHYFSHTAEALKGGLNKGWTGPPPVSPDAIDTVAHTVMEANIYQFSGMKTQAMAREMNEIARTSKGFDDFKRRVVESKRFDKFESYRHTEYANAVNSGMQASRYYSLKERADALPFWRYETMEDGRVREAHAKLNNKVFHHDDKIWNVIYPPNGWRCRCTVTPTDDERGAEPKNKRSAAEFIDPKEFNAMRTGGFAINRAKLGEVFKLSASYNTAGEGQVIGIKENYGRLWRKQRYSEITSRQLPAMPGGAQTRGDAETMLFPAPKQTKAVFHDHVGRGWTFPRDSFVRHTDPTHKKYGKERRWKMAHAIPDVLKEPDEVWLLGTSKKDAPGKSNYKYIKYYKGKTIVVEAQATLQVKSEPSMRIYTWYEADANTIGTHRRGYLLKKNAR